MRELSLAQARRLALAAQGFGGGAATGAGAQRLRRLVQRLGVVQIDSVNVLVRSHYLPAYSRLGGYPREALDRLAYRDRALFEYWGHEASLLPVELHPLLRWRMARARERYETWGGPARLAREHPGYVAEVLAAVRERGPLRAAELDEPGARRGPWWDWSKPKAALEWLFWTGEVTTAGRRGFERVYDLSERVLPARVLAAPTPEEGEAHRALLLHAAGALGVATAAELADYFRLHVPTARARLAELEHAGGLERVRVAGWREPAYTLPGARPPARSTATALLSPFDSLIWHRPRAERLFGFRYRLEIYLPRPRRVHGYYVLPFLHRGELVARVDLKADRAAGRLLVPAAHVEPGREPEPVAAALAPQLRALADWLALPEPVAVGDHGALTVPLRRYGAP